MQPKLDLIGIVVNDMKASLKFYRLLGLDIPPGDNDDGHIEITLDSGMRLAWDTVDVIKSFLPDWQPPQGDSRIGLAFFCGDRDGVDDVYNRITGLGYKGHKEPFDAPWGQRYAQIEDPDGNVLDLFA